MDRTTHMDTGLEKADRCRVVLLYNPKGGVGKTTLAANLTLAMARLPQYIGRRVAAVDLDLSGANLSTVLYRLPLEEVRHRNLARWPELGLEEGRGAALRDYLFKGPDGIAIAAAPFNLSEGHCLNHRSTDRIFQALMAQFDLLVVDGGPGITDAVDMALHHATEVLAVTNREGQSLAQLSKLISALDCPEDFTLDVQAAEGDAALRQAMRERLGKLRVVLNNTLPGGRHRLEREDVETVLGQPVYAEIPYGERVLEALHGKESRQALDLDRRGPFARAVCQLAGRLAGEEPETLRKPDKGSLKGLFSRRRP